MGKEKNSSYFNSVNRVTIKNKQTKYQKGFFSKKKSAVKDFVDMLVY